MAFTSQQVSVSTSAVLLYQAVAGDLEVWIEGDGNQSFWIGGSGVDATNGFAMFGTNSPNAFRTEIRPGDAIYAIAGGSVTVNVLVRSA